MWLQIIVIAVTTVTIGRIPFIHAAFGCDGLLCGIVTVTVHTVTN